MASHDEPTPMMKQYFAIRGSIPEDMILFYRLGDFYEMFNEDAKRAAPVLGVALTQRAGSPLCGVPFHAVESYLAKAVKAGLKIAICEQVEDPKLAKGVVKREITRIITPGTVTEESILDSAVNNFLAVFTKAPRGEGWGLAVLDLSTGDFFAEALASSAYLIDALVRYSPSEVMVAHDKADEYSEICAAASIKTITKVDDWTFQNDAAQRELLSHFNLHSLDGLGIGDEPELISAAGALLRYVKRDLLRNVEHVRSLRRITSDEFLTLDEATALNLDLVPIRSRAKEATLLGVLDTTLTPMGARMMRTFLQRPSGRIDVIEARHKAVEWFVSHRINASSFRSALEPVRDMERLISRIGSALCSGRDLKALELSLAAVPKLRHPFAGGCESALLEDLQGRLHALPELVAMLSAAISDTPPATLRDGGVIRDGFNPALDEYRRLASDGREWLLKYQAQEQERTGIKTLKVRHNKVFGFYIEISRALASQAPADYQRKQTLVNGERFITPELKEYEEKIFGAQDKALALEQEIFEAIRKEVASHTAEIQITALAIAELDVLASFAERALTCGYVMPEMHMGDELSIVRGRHPIVERISASERFVPNDTFLDCSENQIAILTGPNMAGKSTYIRQVAVIAVMAHAGCFVPAETAKIPVMDRVFTRVGAGDDLARGRSTFMVEMQETANILNNATPRSLIVLDEIGRGTSTFDGISIAWSVAEYLHNDKSVKAKTLFATHYHELTDLELQLGGVKNYSVQVKEHGESVVFLRTIARGAADKSYGIQVARLAGLPKQVVTRANEILKNLEEDELDVMAQPKLAKRSRHKIDFDEATGQLHLF